MAQTISELEKERAELLKAIENQAQHISSNRTNTPDTDGHTLKDWLNAAEDVMPSKSEPPKRDTQTSTQSSAPVSGSSKASFFGIIILLSLLLTILGVLYIAYSTVNSELQEVQEVKKTSQDEAVQLQESMSKLEQTVATGGTPERFVALEQRVIELEEQLETLQKQQLTLLAQLERNNLNPETALVKASELDDKKEPKQESKQEPTQTVATNVVSSQQVLTESILDEKLQAYTSGLERRIDEKLSMILDVLMKGDVQPELKDKVLLNGDSSVKAQQLNQPAEPDVSAPRIKQPLVKMVEEVATPVEPVVKAPIDHYSEDVKWLLSQPEQHYILQLASMSDKQALLSMVKQKGLKESRIIEQTRDKSTRYVLVVGSYTSRNEANQVSRQIKNDFGIAPWVRKIKDLSSKLP